MTVAQLRGAPTARTLIAAAVPLTGPGALPLSLYSRTKSDEEQWQRSAWAYYDDVPEVNFAHRFLGNVSGRCKLIPLWTPNSATGAVPLDPDDVTLDEETRKLATLATSTLDRLDATLGGTQGLMGTLSLNTALVGEVFLWGHTDTDSPTGECWEALSTEEVNITGTTIEVKGESGSGVNEAVDRVSDHFIRIWRRHPRKRLVADSPMRSLLATCEELLLLSRSVRGMTTSRLAGAGILTCSEDLSFVPLSQDGGEPSDDGLNDPFLSDLVQAMTLPLQQPDTAAAVVPLIVRGPTEALSPNALRHIVLDRPIDPLSIQLREEAVTRLARGMDVPPEIVTGLAPANHWTAWQVDEQTFKSHVEPLVSLVCEGLTVGFLQPLLRAQGVEEWQQVSVGYDPGALIGHPNQFNEAQSMHASLVVSDSFLRRKGGASDEDAPDEVEYDRRLAQRNRLPPEVSTVLLRLGEVLPKLESLPAAPAGGGKGAGGTSSSPGEPGGTGGEQGPSEPSPSSPETGPPSQAAAMLAAGPRDVGARLGVVDRALFARVRTLVEDTLQRSIEIVGARILRSVNGGRSEMAATLRQEPLGRVALVLGRDAVHQLGIEEDTILRSHLLTAEQPFKEALRRARAADLAVIQDGYGDLPEDFDHDAWDAQTEDHDNRAWAALLGLMVGAATHVLYDPRPTAPPMGEVAVEAKVAPGAIRDVLTQAGGGATATGDATSSPGFSASDDLAGLMDQNYDAQISGWRWVYGDPSARTRPFEPHEDLDGTEFADWNDDALANPDSFPGDEYYYPGDHDGCLCDVEPIMSGG